MTQRTFQPEPELTTDAASAPSINQAHDAETTDTRPRFAIGHMTLAANDVASLAEFYTAIGMRLVVDMGQAVIVELRGGTHLIIRFGQGGQASLDFIVDDIEDTRVAMVAAGATATSIRRGSPHDTFTATDPEGNTLVVHSNHAIGPV